MVYARRWRSLWRWGALVVINAALLGSYTRNAWVGLFVATLVILRLVDAFQLPVVLFLAAIFVVAELTLSAERQ